jgi:hypothetical protein
MMARKLGRTLVAPILPIAVNATGLNAHREMVTRDPRPSTKEIGKDLIDIIVNNGVNEIKKTTAERRGTR